jgi:predicted alpha/beta hydrolase family esterase
VLSCHSLSCSLAAHWAKRNRPGRVAAAFLVSPTDVDLPEHLPGVRDFAPMPLAKFPVPALVVASANDPYVTLARAKEFAENWAPTSARSANSAISTQTRGSASGRKAC